MNILKTVSAGSAFAAAMVIASPAAAVVQTFATFSAPTTAANVTISNTGNSSSRAQDGRFYTTSTPQLVTPGPVVVRFSFLQPALAPYVTNVNASMNIFGTIAKGTPATLTTIPGFGTFFVQTGFSGSIKFLTTTAITVTAPNFVPYTYAIGSNLLTATFAGGSFSGKIGDTTGNANASSVGLATLTFTSDFLNFSSAVSRDAALALTSVAPTFRVGRGANRSLSSLRANLGGQFSSDPVPLVNGLAVALVPEPAVWGMLIVGFGMVGVQTRRRGRSTIVTG